MEIIYQQLMIRDIWPNSDLFLLAVKQKINDSLPDNEVYNYDDFIWNMDTMLKYFHTHYYKTIVNMDNLLDLNYWIDMLVLKFNVLTPSLYMLSRFIKDKVLPTIKLDTSTGGKTTTNTGQNSDEFNMDIGDDKLGLIVRTTNNQDNIDIFKNIDEYRRNTINIELESWLNSFQDLFIDTWAYFC